MSVFLVLTTASVATCRESRAPKELIDAVKARNAAADAVVEKIIAFAEDLKNSDPERADAVMLLADIPTDRALDFCVAKVGESIPLLSGTEEGRARTRAYRSVLTQVGWPAIPAVLRRLEKTKEGGTPLQYGDVQGLSYVLIAIMDVESAAALLRREIARLPRDDERNRNILAVINRMESLLKRD